MPTTEIVSGEIFQDESNSLPTVIEKHSLFTEIYSLFIEIYSLFTEIY